MIYWRGAGGVGDEEQRRCFPCCINKKPRKNRGKALAYRIIFIVVSFHLKATQQY